MYHSHSSLTKQQQPKSINSMMNMDFCWSKFHNNIVNNCWISVCWTLYILRPVDHYLEFNRRLDFNDHMLIHLGIDSVNLNLAFE